MTLSKEQMREYQRKKRAEKKGLQTGVNPPDVNPCQPVNPDVNLCKLQESVEALGVRVQLLEESLAKLVESQAKVGVVPGGLVKKVTRDLPSTYTGPITREMQARQHVPMCNRSNNG